MAHVARFVIRHRLLVVGAWIVLTVVGMFSAAKLSSRWFQSFSIPGYSAYEANQRTLKAFGSGEQVPLVVVLTKPGGDITKVAGNDKAIAAVAKAVPDSRVGSWYSTHSDMYLSKDRHTMVATIYPPGNSTFSSLPPIPEARASLKQATPAGVTSHLTGRDAIFDSQGGSTGPGVFTETLIGAVGALIILLFVFGTLPAIGLPLAMAAASILTTFACVLALTYVTDVSIIVQFLVALVGLGVSIDYALLMVFRFREELASGESTEDALVETMTHAGRSVIVSGSTVAIGLLSMVILPLPFIRSIGLGGMLIPLVAVSASITLLPALLSMLGPRINRLRVMPKRFVNPPSAEQGFWASWARLVTRRPIPVFIAGLVIVTLVVLPAFHINPSDAQLKDEPAAGDADAGRAAIKAAGIPDGVYLPYIVLAEGQNVARETLDKTASILGQAPGIWGAAAPPSWQKANVGLVEAFGLDDGSSRTAKTTISNLRNSVLPGIVNNGGPTKLTLGGAAPEERDFIKAVYGKFPYVLLFVLLLTFVLLMRAFRSVVLPIKAVILNLVSLGAAYGIVVFIFQDGHGSDAIWNIKATDAVISWIPLMIFAFLYGISMDYEVFMITRMREAYDETHVTKRAIELGLARTGKLVTSAALVLMFAFFSLSTSPGPDIKQFAIGLSAGIIFDATVIRALLVPSTMMLLGRWNWWLPHWTARVLRTRPSPLEPVAAGAGER
ncbi:MAG: MMPL family transporter [Actinobacteria bacterium]|nr:MAG: MMPL family transporter [Actinomycetota bacterium]